ASVEACIEGVEEGVGGLGRAAQVGAADAHALEVDPVAAAAGHVLGDLGGGGVEVAVGVDDDGFIDRGAVDEAVGPGHDAYLTVDGHVIEDAGFVCGDHEVAGHGHVSGIAGTVGGQLGGDGGRADGKACGGQRHGGQDDQGSGE